MSIQFRARIKSAGDYTSLLSDDGVCCYPDGTQSGADPVSYISCINAGGYFQYVQVLQGEIPSEVVCPDISDTGCCCACEYVDNYDDYLESVEAGGLIPQYTSGLKDVSLCECNRIGGVWSADSCETYSAWDEIFNLCTGGAYLHGTPDPVEHDRRFPEGCCVSHQNGSYVCNHVCSSGECSDLQEAAWPREQCCPDVANESLCIDCPHCCASHYATVACGNDPTIPEQDQIMCGEESTTAYAAGGTAFLDDEFNNILVVPKQSREKDIEERYKNTIENILNIAGKRGKGVSSVCITTKDRVNYGCEIKTKNLCSGIWMGLNDAGFPFNCNDSEVTTIKDFLKNGTVSREVVDGWKIGQYQIAGYYAGVFNYGGEDGHHESLVGFGNPKTGPCIDYKLEGESNDVKEFKSFTKSQYAVLVLPRDLDTKPSKLHPNNRNMRNQSVSKFDSVRNMLTPLNNFNKVNSYIYNGIGGWAIPAQHTLAWMANQIQKPEFIENTKNNKAYKWRDMKKSYWSSTLLGSNNHQLIMAHIQDFEAGFVGVCPITHMRLTRPIRLLKLN